jgi:outer membrane protein TolC
MRTATVLFLVLLLNSVQAQKRDLDYYISKAKAFSPLINQAQNENKILGLDIQQLRSILFKPEINIEASVLFAPIISHDDNQDKFELVSNGATNYTGYDMLLTEGGEYQSFISLKQPLFTNHSFKVYSSQADIERQINNNHILLTSHELEKVISHQFILCLKSEKSAEISLELLKEFEERLLVMQKLVENAIYKESDLMLMQIELDNYRLDYETYRSDFRSDLYDLNLLCGIKDTMLVDLQDLDLQVKNISMGSSVFLTSYYLDSLNINAERTISNLKYKPQVSLFANTGLDAAYLPVLNRFGFSAGLTFSWNIFDGHLQKILKQKSDINLLTLDFEKQNFITQQEINKKSILDQLAFLEKKIQLTDSQVLKYDRLLQAYRDQLSMGQISVIDFKNTEKEFATKKHERVILDLEKQALIISLNYWNF